MKQKFCLLARKAYILKHCSKTRYTRLYTNVQLLDICHNLLFIGFVLISNFLDCAHVSEVICCLWHEYTPMASWDLISSGGEMPSLRKLNNMQIKVVRCRTFGIASCLTRVSLLKFQKLSGMNAMLSST